MVLPILISVSVAPGSYLPAATAAAGSDRPAAVSNAMASLRFMGSSLGDGMAGAFLTPRLLSFEPAPDMGDGEADQPCRTRWHEVDDEQDDDAEQHAGEAGGDAFGEVRHVQHEGAADHRAGDPADAADHQADQEIDREHEGETDGGHELHHDGTQIGRASCRERVCKTV